MRTEQANPRLARVVQIINRVLEFVFRHVTITERSGAGYRERRLWLSWQNLCEDPKGYARGFPWNGRAWLHWHGKKQRTFRWEWHFKSKSCGVGINFDNQENELAWDVCLPPVALYFGISGILSRDWMHKHWEYEGRQITFRIHDYALWWDIWRDEMAGWDRSVPKWRQGCFHFDEFLLGKTKHSERELSFHDVLIPMPEGGYPATVRLLEGTWKRSRWFPHRVLLADVKMKKHIPFPGKGENSWDCGEDGLYGLHTQARNVEDAIAATVKSALRSRRRYGSGVMMKYPAPTGT